MKVSLRSLLLAFTVVAVLLLVNAARISSMFEANESSELMPLKTFWQIIDESWTDATKDSQFRNNLRVRLEKLSENKLQRFYSRYNERNVNAYDWRLWDAVFLINGGCSDDGFMDFRDYLISRGSAIYERTIEDPETLLDDPLSGDEWPYSEEHFGFIPVEIAESKGWDAGGWLSVRRDEPSGVRINTDIDQEIKTAFPRIYRHWTRVNLKYEKLRKSLDDAVD